MKLDAYLSTKFRHLSLLATLAVITLHSRTFRWSGASDWTDSLQEQIARGCVFAVPVFLVVSGFLFVSSYEKYGWGGLLKRKFWTLYVPMVLWMVLSELIVLPSRWYLGELTHPKTFLEAPVLLFETFSVSFHFWYVRALIIAFALAPAIHWLTYTVIRAWTAFFIWTIVFLCFHVPVLRLGPYGFQHVADSGQFLLLGICLARTNLDFVRIRVPLCVLAGVALPFVWPYEGWLRLLEFVLVWSGYDVVMQAKWVSYCQVGSNGLAALPLFFIYCIHTSIVKYLSGFGRLLLGIEPWAKMTGFFVNMLSFFICLVVAYYVRQHAKRVYVVLSGGR